MEDETFENVNDEFAEIRARYEAGEELNDEDMDKIAEAIAMVIKGGEEKVPEARAIVQALTDKYPLI